MYAQQLCSIGQYEMLFEWQIREPMEPSSSRDSALSPGKGAGDFERNRKERDVGMEIFERRRGPIRRDDITVSVTAHKVNIWECS